MVSVVIPVYNAEKTIGRCVDSILSQTYSDIEVILIDDDSHDDSGIICKNYCEKDSRVKYYKKENGGAASARNFGIKRSTGKWIQFVDADDYIKCDMIEKMFDAMLINNCDWVICGFESVSLNGRTINSYGNHYCKTREEMCNVITEYYEAAILHSCWNKLYKRELIYEFMTETYIFGEDYIFNLNYLKNVSSFTVISDPLYIYDCTNESITRGKKKNSLNVINEQYKISHAVLTELFQNNYLTDKISSFYIKNVLNDFAMQTPLFEIKSDKVRTLLKAYENQIKSIHGNGELEYYIQTSDYRGITYLLRKNKTKSIIKMALRKIVYKLRSVCNRS